MALPINLDELIKGNIIESERIEFKEGWNPEPVLHTICAFANDFNNIGGGYIIIGIAEENGVVKLPPSGIRANQIDKIQKELLKICYYISPNYFPTVSPEVINGKHIIIVWIPPGDTRPYKAPKNITDKTNKPYYIRRMSSTVQANDQEVLKLIELTAKVTFDNRINQQAALDDISLINIATFLKEIRSSLYEDISRIPFADLCIKMNIARGPKEDIRPLNASLLLFSNEPHKFFRGAKIELVVYEDLIGDKFYEKIFTGPIHVQLRNVLDYINNSLIKEEIRKIEGIAEAKRFFNYPYESIEEAISNAVYHKSYERENPIEVNIRPNCIEVLSFPGPMPPVDNEMLKKNRIVSRDYRNSRIGDFLKELHLTEGRGTGIPKIRNFLYKNGSPEPIFETDKDRTYFLTTIKIHPDFKSETSSDQVTDQVGTKLALSRHQVKIMRRCTVDTGIVNLMKIEGRSDRTKFRNQVLNPLVEEKLIEMTIPEKPQSPNQKYRLTKRGKILLEKLTK